MYYKIEQDLEYNPKRDFKLTTPCCNKSNKDGKFVNFKGAPSIYGYCHSCGTTTYPQQLYRDERGDEYYWDCNTECFTLAIQTSISCITKCNTSKDNLYYNSNKEDHKEFKFVDFKIVNFLLSNLKENNLLQYLRRNYSDIKVNIVKKQYYIGTGKDGGTVFWMINKDRNVQKAKISYYTLDGRRTNKFQVPYKNADGYYSCLFGEHLLKDNCKPIILVESEKSAIVASIEFPQYTWLAYSGINGLTTKKLEALIDLEIIIIPDISENAVAIMNGKKSLMKKLNIRATIYDMTFGKSDAELKDCNLYNCDIEDVLRMSLI